MGTVPTHRGRKLASLGDLVSGYAMPSLLDVFELGEEFEGLHDWCLNRAKVKGKEGLLSRLNWVLNLKPDSSTSGLRDWLGTEGRDD